MEYYKKLIIRLTLILLIPSSLFVYIFTPITVSLTRVLLYVLGYSFVLQENIIYIGKYSIEFIPACIAASAYHLLLVIILFTKDLNLTKSLKLFFYGSLLILFVNLIRIILIIDILIRYGVNYFDSIHLFFWTFVSSIYVAIVWLLLVKRIKIKSIPVYSDTKYLYNLSRKKKTFKRKTKK